MSEKQINNFSLISRLFGNLFYRSPTDEVLAGAFTWLQQKGLSQVWALDTDKESELVLSGTTLPSTSEATLGSSASGSFVVPYL